MNDVNQKILFEKCPMLYHLAVQDRSTPEPITLFGIECGDGWFSLVYNLSEQIENYNQEMAIKIFDYEPIRVVQVKEKYGTLRFYTNLYVEIVENWIQEAEELSSKTCEICGAPAELKERRGWYSTVCDACDQL